MNSQIDALGCTRRHFLLNASLGLGGMAFGSLCSGSLSASENQRPPHIAAKAKHVIYLFQSGGPAQQDLFDYKPLLNEKNGEQLPDHVRGGQRLTGMSVNQASIPLAGSIFKFARHGRCGAWISDLLPHTAGIVDDLCFIKSMFTEAINHDPAITFFQTGSQVAGRPSIGSWISYGLGSMNQNLPTFVVLVTRGKGDQPLYARLWGNGFLDSKYQGVKFRVRKGRGLLPHQSRRHLRTEPRTVLDTISALNRLQFERELDPEIESRIAQYEMAFRMQTSVPEVTDISNEPKHVLDLYGPDVTKPGTFASNCLLARRLAERGVRFIQLYHQGWDQHGNLPAAIRVQARDRSALCRPDQGSQAARNARRHACHLGRGVRSNQLFAGQAHGDGLRPRPSPALLHDLAGRRRSETRLHVRPDRFIRLQHRRCRGQSTATRQTSLHPRRGPRS